LRYANVDSFHYAFDIVTYPGTLVVTGDMGSYTFQRLIDMFHFFNQEHINTQYWGEKLVAHSNNDFKRYSPSDLEEYVKDHFECRKEEYSEEERIALWAEIESVLGAENEYEAHDALSNFEDDNTGYTFEDSWEADLWHYSYRFIWICYAIQYGVSTYYKEKEKIDSALSGTVTR